MIESLHFSRTLERQLIVLQQAGKKGELAVKHYARICTILRSAGPETGELYVKRTKNGEYRLKHCVKYDLGGGYRLITVRVGDRLYLPFVGSHDEADQWLDRQRCHDFEPVESAYQAETVTRPVQAGGSDIDAGVAREPQPDHYEEKLTAKLDDELLKSIFRGLFQKQHSR